ncbi:unnamed protein product, partial [marine sediment metagenome]
MTENKICFVIAPIGEPETEIRKRSDKIFKHIITPIVKPLGYTPIRADHISEPGIITNQIIQHVIEDPLVIADLTGYNPNVFYELAIRHAIKKPFIQIIDKGETIPFDIILTRTISMDITDLDNVEETKENLKQQIKNIEEGKITIDTPISYSLDLNILKKSEKPEERSIVDLVEGISEIRKTLDEIGKHVREQYYDPPTESFSSLLDVMGFYYEFSEIAMNMYEIYEEVIESLKPAEGFNDEIKMKLNYLEEMTNRLKRLKDDMIPKFVKRHY